MFVGGLDVDCLIKVELRVMGQVSIQRHPVIEAALIALSAQFAGFENVFRPIWRQKVSRLPQVVRYKRLVSKVTRRSSELSCEQRCAFPVLLSIGQHP